MPTTSRLPFCLRRIKPFSSHPAMNPHMWLNPATRRNVVQLQLDGVRFVGPAHGEMAERGETGPGRLVEVPDLIVAIENAMAPSRGEQKPLTGRHVIVTSGPTHEPIDPVRYLADRSSGKQGHELAAAAARPRRPRYTGSRAGVASSTAGVRVIRVVTASEMLEAVKSALPADIAIFAAAVADWRVARPAPARLKNHQRQGRLR